MSYLAVVLALQIAVPPGEGSPPSLPAGVADDGALGPEAGPPMAALGPEPGPPVAALAGDPNDWWHRRDRRLRGATIGLGAVTGAAFLASGLFLYGSYKTHGPAPATDAGARATAIIGFLALPALIGVGTAWGVYRKRGWEPAPARARMDPRRDPAWAMRDRKLRRATIALGAVTGVMVLSIPLSYAIGAAVIETPDCSGEGDCQAPISAGMGLLILVIAEATFAGASAIALAGVGGAWGAHRRPLRKWNATVTPGGLQIRF